ncbi:CPA_1a_G0009900.mRNA.1.CDS.1 [Saccharomyces cerevisiae]|nr:Ino2p [Saccharomyces cerevisiae YJM1399]CAI4340055.1 CPI_1c_G0009870.mRNA.1.CDS.1 [Saccharomyces cerevisiae]CAI4340953.1 CPA_1a_G0009900.mRNA.1.CDS.1 [Saccharomyces cerevisiae]CAI4342605.1 ADE_G0009690.mRNA.1.CDS.1 [Saccharomyces cerevisiae]CAI4346825.1 BBM_1a_G0009760.mRNA.1.CDS.1 [Saccharomyces cerevisiae]
MQQATGNELLGILDLDNDIDFETAYQMLSSNFDDQMSAHIHENTFSATSPPLLTHELGIIPNVATVQPSHVETIPADNQTHHAPLHTHAHHLNHNPHQPSMGFDQTLGLKLSPSSSGLLSTNESNAIEQFLDNLISQDMMSSNASMNSDSHLHIRSPKKQHRYTELNQRYPETHPHSNTGELPTNTADVPTEFTTREGPHQPIGNDHYNPPPFSVPEIRIPDSDIPANIEDDPVKVRKWKHVQMEKIRRINTKEAFERLIKSVRTPPKENGKRIPKHILLTCVMNDIKSIRSANEALQHILDDS